MSKPIICLDFDGCVHMYTSKWVDETVIPDPPVPGAFEWIEKSMQVFSIHIYSRRSISERGRNAMRRWFRAHNGGDFLEELIFAHEKPAAFLTIDDRAIRFDGDWSALDPHEMIKFKPWNRK